MSLTPEEEEVKLYTTKQVANLCAVQPETVRRWINEGVLPGINVQGFWRVRHLDLKKFLDDRHGSISAET